MIMPLLKVLGIYLSLAGNVAEVAAVPFEDRSMGWPLSPIGSPCISPIESPATRWSCSLPDACKRHAQCQVFVALFVPSASCNPL